MSELGAIVEDELTNTLISKLKMLLLPKGDCLRRIPFGIAKGVLMEINFAIHTRTYLGLYEVELASHFRRLCCNSVRSFDVGGQVGYDALLMAKVSGGRVISFECDEASCERLRRNVTANSDLAGRIEVFQAFVAGHSDPSRHIPHVTLDDVAFGGRGFVPDFIKMDIEGGEADALSGCERILRENRPSLIIETHSLSLERKCLAALASYGYSTLIVDQRRWLREHRPIEHNRWLVAEHREGLQDSYRL